MQMQTFCYELRMIMDPHQILPPPIPIFLASAIAAIISFLDLALLEFPDDSLPPPFPPLVNVISTIITALKIGAIPIPLIQLLFPRLRFYRNVGIDVWSKFQQVPRRFWYLTAETPATLDSVVQRVAPDVTKPRMFPRIPISNRRRSCILDVRNRVLLVTIWLRIYPTYHTLASMFQISKSTVHEEIYHIVPILFLHFRRFLTWHNLRQWSTFVGQWKNYPNAVGCIDATIHRIRRPTGRLQTEFYRGDKKKHFISTQMIDRKSVV